MMDVPVPLDIVFLRNEVVVAISPSAPPCTAKPCPTYGPGPELIDQVIELRGGPCCRNWLENWGCSVDSEANGLRQGALGGSERSRDDCKDGKLKSTDRDKADSLNSLAPYSRNCRDIALN